MRWRLLSTFAAAIAAISPAVGQEQNSEIIQVSPDMFLRWYGHDGRTYFVQVSDPNNHLKSWTWAPIIETGNDEDISYEVDGTADKGFFRLWFTDQPTTDPDGDDFDSDFLTNWEEVSIYQTNPLNDDTDGDGIWDDYEVFGSLGYVTNPNSSDTDGDGLSDLDEIEIYNSDPTVTDVDGDGDGLLNPIEVWLGLDPALADTDGDGITDDLEDADYDTLSNLAEFSVILTNPKRYDTDLDTLNDGWEVANGFDPRVNNLSDANPLNDPGADPDNDGLTNSEEEAIGTKANDPDSDGDGVDDQTERDQGSNPNDPNDSGPPPTGTTPVNVTFGDDSGSHSEKYQVLLTPLEGDTTGHTERFRTNREYGESQTDTFHLPKGAKYRLELIHIDTNEDDGVPDYDHTLEIDTSKGCLVVDDPDTIMGTSPESGGTTFVIEGKNATLFVPLFKPKEVEFSSSTITGWLSSDDTSVTYDPPHWQDSNDDGDADDPGERKYPIAYIRDTPPTIAGKIAVKPSGLTSVSGFSAKIKVTGPGAIAIPETAANLGTDELELPATPSSGNFVNEIDYMNPMTLTWEIEVNDEGHWCEAGETKNRTYVTLGAPATTMRQETLFDIGCRNADGETVAADATAKIWTEFTDRVVRKVDPTTGQPTGSQMTYYADYNPLDSNGVEVCTAPQLLEANDGQCGSWADLLIRIRQVQGIDDPDEYVVFGSPNTSVGFAVKNWTFAQSGTSGNATYPYLNICPLGNGSINANFEAVRGTNSYNWAYAEVTDSSGIEGQGTTNPASLFGNHQVMISGQFYDPSYGVLHATLADIDSFSVDGYFILSVENLDETTYGLDLNSDGDQTDLAVPTACYLFRKNPAGNDLIIRDQINR